MLLLKTGAGKTNVAMLTVAAHFRDVGLIGHTPDSLIIETGKKVVYIAPMKALAQEVVEKFSSKLKSLRLIVRELTGDMQLTRAEAESAHVIVTTPEKWDVVTRKSGMDENALGNQCGLLIIDEVHLLADERGAVIESVVSRLHRLVESRQRQVRIVALSATLPNYDDVAEFLQVPDRGVFFFGPEYRPVPLQQTFIGVTVNNKNRMLKEKRMNEICFDVVLDSLQRGYQVMVFVHSRKGTGDTARSLAELASEEGVLESNFVTAGKEGANGDAYKRYVERVKKSRNRELASHFENGCGIHHAGMLRGDRKLTEQMFNDGAIKVLCCTATLAWGINLPAHSVVIKGTEVYNPEKGGVVDLSILDVQQIFGRAGRPQFDSSGEATLITNHEAFPRYMNKLVRPVPIESNFVKQLADHLNAEVVGGTVTNINEAAQWLTYTYLYVRMMRNPLAYGINADQKADDPLLRRRCLDLVSDAAKLLDANKMIRYDVPSGNLGVVDNGRVAAHFYIQAESIATFLELFAQIPAPTDGDLCRVICSATEFRNMKLRQEEMDELQQIVRKSCPFRIRGAGTDEEGNNLIVDPSDKAFVLLQAYISRAPIKSFTLISDMNYIASNAGRVARALFEMCLQEKKAAEATKFLRIANSVDRQNWWFKTPFRNFEAEFKEYIYSGIESYCGGSRGSGDSFESILSLLEMQPEEVGEILKSNRTFGARVQRFVGLLPKLLVSCKVKPVTSTVLRFQVNMVSVFEWDSKWHGGAQNFWMLVEDRDSNKIHYHEHVIMSKRSYTEPVTFDFSIPIFSNVPKQYHIRVIADGWVGVEHVFPVPLQDFEIPTESTSYTDLLDLTPLPVTALNNPTYEQLYAKFKTFNPVKSIHVNHSSWCLVMESLHFVFLVQDSKSTFSRFVPHRFSCSTWGTGKILCNGRN
jgi:activating signal cointegrator complex subunit 3